MKLFLSLICIIFYPYMTLGQSQELSYSLNISKQHDRDVVIYISQFDTTTIKLASKAEPWVKINTIKGELIFQRDISRNVDEMRDATDSTLLATMELKYNGKKTYDVLMPDGTRLNWKKINKKTWTYSKDGVKVMQCEIISSDGKLYLKMQKSVEDIPAIEYAILGSQCLSYWLVSSKNIYPTQVGVAALRTLVL